MDCDDSDCATDAACGTVDAEVCNDTIDNDGDGDTDCDDTDCAGDASCTADAEICDDTIDNDDDGDIDCDDTDCADDAACATAVEICDDETDNDDDGDVDCDDADCADDAACEETAVCGDGTVDDGEACDDGDANSDTDPDACRTTCEVAACGDGVTDAGEDCDGGDQCDDACVFTDFCGNGRVDDGETCDDGLNNSNSIPNACRNSCVLPACGDEVVDAGEECDAGAANDDAGACTSVCAVNVAVDCAAVAEVIDLDAIGFDQSADGTFLTYAGNIRGADDDHSPGVGCVDDEAATGADAVHTFTATADATIRVSTDNFATATDTVLYTVASCTDNTSTTCQDNASIDGGSTIYLDATAGQRFFIVVDAVGAGDAYRLDFSVVEAIAGAGEACSADIVCEAGLLCASDTCVADAAPVLTEIVSTTAANGDVTHSYRGSDANGDVIALEVTSVTFEDGSVETFGIRFDDLPVVVDGDTFALSITLNWFNIMGLNATSFTGRVFDANGNASEIVTSLISAYVAPPEVAEGEACDITQIANICAAPSVCTLQPDESTICADGSAPVFTAFAATRVRADAVRFDFEGSDLNGDAVSWEVDFLGETGTNLGSSEFPFDISVLGQVEFATSTLITGLTPFDVYTAEARLIDATGAVSETLTAILPQPELALLGEECDLSGVASVCDEGACSPTATSAVCADAEAPFITAVDASYGDLSVLETITLSISGGDLNGDVSVIYVDFVTADGDVASIDFDAADMTPDPTGRTAFTIPAPPSAAGGPCFAPVFVTLEDSSGLLSESVEDGLGNEAATGEACTLDGMEFCATEGDTCGSALTCEVGVAPTLTSLTATRNTPDEVTFFITGEDVNGDVTNQISTFFIDEEVFNADVLLILDEPVTGQTTFSVTSTITGFGDSGITSADLGLVDALGLESSRLTVVLPPLVDLDGACIGDGVTDLCDAGLTCTDNVCQQSPPEVTDVVADYNAATRSLDITVAGVDLDEDVANFYFEFRDDEFESVFAGPIALTAGIDGDVVYGDSGAFTVTFSLAWDNADVIGVSLGDLIIDDSRDNESGLPFSFGFVPVQGFALPCDVEEAVGICVPGLICDGDTLLCDVDLADPCGGIAVLEYADVSLAGVDGVTVPFDTTGTENLSNYSCTGFGGSAGGEVAVHFIADETAIVTVTTDTEATGYDTYVYARGGFCLAPQPVIACNDDNATSTRSTITFEALAGEEFYIFLDGYSASGTGEALFTFEPLSGPGDACDVDPCAEGLLCDPATVLCVNPPTVGESCAVLTCEDGLFCSIDTEICMAAGQIGDVCLASGVPCESELYCNTLSGECNAYSLDGESCDELECAAGLFCDFSVLTCASPGDEGDDCLEVPCAGTLFCNTLDFTCYAPGTEGVDCLDVPCATGFECTTDDTCRAPVGEGESCEFASCQDGLSCADEICVSGALEGESCETLDCALGLTCGDDLVCFVPTSCDEAIVLDPDTTTFTATFTGDEPFSISLSCAGFILTSNIVFEWTSDYDGLVSVNTNADTDTDMILEVSEGVCEVPLPAVIDCVDDDIDLDTNVTFTAVSGTTYTFVFDTWDGPGAVISGAIERIPAP